MRVLILDEAAPKGGPAERKAALAQRFTELTAAEIGDLAAIPPERLAVYTRVIFAGERAMLSWTYPNATAVVVHLCRAAGDDRPQQALLFDLVRDVHRVAPWRSNSARELARNFEHYVNDQRADWVTAWPGLPGLIRFERLELEVFYALDDAGQRLDLTTTAAQSVDQLLQTRVFLPRYVRRADSTHDLLALTADLGPQHAVTEPLPAPQRCLAVCGRRAGDLIPTWQRLTEADFAALGDLDPGSITTLDEVATAYLGRHAADAFSGEQAAFESFFGWLVKLAHHGVLLAAPPSR